MREVEELLFVFRTMAMNFATLQFDHVGIRITDLGMAEAFYAKLGFVRDPDEFSLEAMACGLINASGLRIHLIFNGVAHAEGNVLMDVAVRRPGYTHAAFIVDSMDELVEWLRLEGIRISEGPAVMGDGRRRVCFIRDPDLNVLEFNEILSWSGSDAKRVLAAAETNARIAEAR